MTKTNTMKQPPNAEYPNKSASEYSTALTECGEQFRYSYFVISKAFTKLNDTLIKESGPPYTTYTFVYPLTLYCNFTAIILYISIFIPFVTNI